MTLPSPVPPPPPLNPEVEMSVSFDINQLGPNLCWVITEDAGKRNLYRVTGAHAGSVHMQKHDKVFVRVTAYSGPLDDGKPGEHDFDVTVIGCTLMTVPRLREKGVLYQPSPFTGKTGEPAMPSIEIGDFELMTPATTIVTDTGVRVLLSTEGLDVREPYGIWEFSLVLTVDIRHQDGQRKRRVYRFDPEAEVGTGTQSHGGPAP